jgi:hypothetical protein
MIARLAARLSPGRSCSSAGKPRRREPCRSACRRLLDAAAGRESARVPTRTAARPSRFSPRRVRRRHRERGGPGRERRGVGGRPMCNRTVLKSGRAERGPGHGPCHERRRDTSRATWPALCSPGLLTRRPDLAPPSARPSKAASMEERNPRHGPPGSATAQCEGAKYDAAEIRSSRLDGRGRGESSAARPPPEAPGAPHVTPPEG